MTETIHGPAAPLVARPARTPAPAIVIVPSIFGLNDESQRWLRFYSAEGFLTFVYDPFWRTAPGALEMDAPGGREKAHARRDAFVAEAGVTDLAAVIARVRAMPECNGKVAVVGYCFGGRYAVIAAARLDVDAVVSFHGIRVGDSLEEARRIRVPASLHFGDSDRSAPLPEVEAVQDAVRGNPQVELFIYPGVGHSFTWPGNQHYDAAADAASMERAMRVLRALFTR